MFRRHLENVPWDAVSTTAGKTPARNREEQQYQGLMKARVNYAMCFRRHLENVPWDAVNTTAGKAVTRNTEEQQYCRLMKPRVNYAMCLGAILKMYPGMLSAQLLGRLLPEIEKSSNIRDFSLTGLKNNSHKCYMYM